MHFDYAQCKQKGSPRFAVEAGQAGILILVGILIIAAVAGGAYYFGRQTTTPKPQNPSPSATQSFPPLYPNLKWEEKIADRYFFRDTGGNILTLDGYQVESEILKNHYSIQESLFDYYRNQLTSLGWKENLAESADGSEGGSIGFYKGTDHFIVGTHNSAGLIRQPGPRATITYTIP